MAKVYTSKKTEISGSLRRLKVGDCVTFTSRQAKEASVWDAVYRLNKDGFKFHATLKGVLNGIKVTRLN